MGIRETMNKSARAVATVATVVILAAGAYVIREAMGGSGAPPIAAKTFYTTDDGKTWFTDGIYKAAPFDHGGKPAYGAAVLQCGGKPFVAYVSRLSGNFLAEARALEAKQQEADFGPRFEALLIQGLEVRRPGAKIWYRADSTEGQKLVADALKCPDGTDAQPVMP